MHNRIHSCFCGTHQWMNISPISPVGRIRLLRNYSLCSLLSFALDVGKLRSIYESVNFRCFSLFKQSVVPLPRPVSASARLSGTLKQSSTITNSSQETKRFPTVIVKATEQADPAEQANDILKSLQDVVYLLLSPLQTRQRSSSFSPSAISLDCAGVGVVCLHRGGGTTEAPRFIGPSTADLGERMAKPKSANDIPRFNPEASSLGAQLVVFPEAFIGGYPRGTVFAAVIGSRSAKGREDYRKYHAAAIDVPGPEVERLAGMAARFKIYIVIGVVERVGGTLYCTILYFDSH